MIPRPLASVSDEALIDRLRRAADYGFANNERFMFDELVWRFNQLKKEARTMQ